jgi:hypothetical protein
MKLKWIKIVQLIANAPCLASGYSFKNSEGYHPLNCKNGFSSKPKTCGLSLSTGLPLQITDSRNRLTAIVSIAGRSLHLQFKQISSCMPIFAISNNGKAHCCFNQKRLPAGNAGKLSAMNVNGLSAIGCLQHEPKGHE